MAIGVNCRHFWFSLCMEDWDPLGVIGRMSINSDCAAGRGHLLRRLELLQRSVSYIRSANSSVERNQIAVVHEAAGIAA